MAQRSAQWQKVRVQAFERDKKRNAPCALCKRPIDYSLGMSTTGKNYNPKCWEPDHIIPVHTEKGKALELDLVNIQPSHAGCNRSKHDRAGINLLGEPSEDWWS